MRILPCIAALLVLVFVAGGGASAQPAVRLFLPMLARPPQLVFVDDRDSGTTIVELAPDGTGRRTLSGPVTNDSRPLPSPDGSHIAFVSTRGGQNAFYVMDRDGSRQRWLADCNICGEVSWLPDGKRLLVQAWELRSNPTGNPWEVSVITFASIDGVVVTLPDNARVSRDGALAAYVIAAGGTSTLFVRPTEGGQATALSSARASLSVASWLPDGRRLLFEANYGYGVRKLFLASLDGKPLREVGGEALSPAWSPDGSRLVYTEPNATAEGPYRITIVEGNEELPRQLVVGSDPAWSPDGGRIAFLNRAERGGPGQLKVIPIPGGRPATLAQNIFRLFGWTPDSSRVVALTYDDPPQVLLVSRYGGATTRIEGVSHVVGVNWSPDGALALVSEASYGVPRSFIVRGDGSGLRELVGVTQAAWTPEGRLLGQEYVQVPPRVYSRLEESAEPLPIAEGGMVALSPRGDQVAYVRGGRLFVSLVGRAAERALAPALSISARPAWSPDGTRLAMVARSGEQPGLYVVEGDGTALRRLPGCNEGCSNPAWSPDGTKLLYDGGGIYLVEVDGEEPARLTTGREPAWSPDGRQVAYVVRGSQADSVMLMGADGSEARAVVPCETYYPTATCSYPVWSPDGSRLAFGVWYDYGKGTTSRVHVVGVADGKEVQQAEGFDPRWPRGSSGPVMRYESRFGFSLIGGLYWMSSNYLKLNLGSSDQAYPPGHGNVLEYSIAP